MVRSPISFGQKPVQTGTKAGATFTVARLTQPVTVLAFLVAIMLSVLIVRNTQAGSGQSSEIQQETVDQVAPAEATQSEASQNSEATTPTQTNNADTQSINTEMRVENGQAEVSVEVNGEQVPVRNEGSTHRTIIQDGSQTTVDVNIQNGQSNTTTTTHGTANSSSYSSNFQSQTVITSP